MIKVNHSSLIFILVIIILKILTIIGGTIYSWTINFPEEQVNETYGLFISILSPVLFIIIYLYFKEFLNQLLKDHSLDKIILGIVLLIVIGIIEQTFYSKFSGNASIKLRPSAVIGLATFVLNIIFIIKIFKIKSNNFILELRIVGFSQLMFLLPFFIIFIPLDLIFIFLNIIELFPFIGFLILFNKALQESKKRELISHLLS